ncbi:MAG: DUF1292 domain-containing protein [Oscillospiraceae bacterium]|nr:DUF1292 domain-containing protein [Oscillospiraceae bacterium]
MSDDMGPVFVSMTGEDGDVLDLEYIDEIEWNGATYRAYFPAVYEDEEDSDEVETGMIIMRVEIVNGEETLVPVDPDAGKAEEDEYDAVYEEFMEQILWDDEE